MSSLISWKTNMENREST